MDPIIARMRAGAALPAGQEEDPVITMMRAAQDDAAGRAALAVGMTDAKPDVAAEHLSLARRYNTTPEVVEAFPEEFKARMRMELARSAMRDAPQLQRRIAQQPNTAALIHDDLPNAAGVEKALTFERAANYVFSKDSDTLLDDAGYYGSQLFRAGGAMVAPVFTKIFQAIGAPLAGVDYAREKYVEANGGIYDGWRVSSLPFSAARWFDEYAQRFPIDNKAAFSGKVAQTIGTTLGLVSEALATGGAAAPQTLSATAMQVLGANAAHGVRAMMVPSSVAAQQVAGEVINRGGSVGDAIKAGTASYITNTVGGIVPFAVPGSLAYRMGTGALTGVLTAEASRDVMRWALPDSMQPAPANAEELSMDALMGALFGGLVGPKAAAHQLLKDTADAHVAEEGFARVNQVSQLSTASLWKQRDPEGFREFVRAVAEEGELANVYIEGKAFAQGMERAGIRPEQLEETMPAVAQQLREAQLTDGYLRIPTEEYASLIAGTPLDKAILPELKVDPAGMNWREAQAFYQEHGARMQEAAAQLAQGKQEQDAMRASQQRVADALAQQLDTLGRFTPEVNRVYATLQAALLTRIGQRMGMTAEESAARFAPRLAGGALQGGLEQGPKGAFVPGEPGTIALLKDADLSTYLHETGHWALDTYTRIAAGMDAPPELRADIDRVFKHYGVESLEKWHGMSLDEQRPFHERFAREFEAYLMEGKAPSRELVPFFQRFRAWMVNIYRTLAGLNVQLSAEVRQVFDRMLATDEAIREAQAMRVFEPLFTEKPAGVSAEEWAKYEELGARATNDAIEDMQSRSLRDMKWLSNAKARAVKDLQKQGKAARDAITREVEEQVGSEPAYRFQDGMKKLGKKAAEGDVEALADSLGFKSAEEALRAAAEAPPRKEVIEGLVDRYMIERHGELSSPEAIDAAASAAVHNDARARFMATGLAMLTKSPIPAAMLVRGAREAAHAAIGELRIRDLTTRQYEAAETKANREAIKLAAKDPLAAAQAQRAALLNNQMVKAVHEAQEDVRKALDYFKRTQKTSAQDGMRGEMLVQLNELLARFDLRTSATPKDRKPLAEWVTDTAEKLSAVMPDLPAWVLNDGYRVQYKDLTVSEMRGLRDAARQLEHLARREQKQYMAIRQMEFAAERGAILDEIRKHWADAFDKETGAPKGIEPDFVPSLKKAVGKLGDKFAGEFLNAETILSILGGGKFGIVNESLFGRLSQRSDWKAERLSAIYKDLKVHFDAYSVKEKYDFARKDIATPAGLDTPLTRENALVVALLHGNAEGRERLANYGWDEAKQQKIINLLDARDVQLANAIWKLFDQSLWPELKALNDNTRGKSPPKVEPLPFKTAGGEATGGYFKLKYDTTLDERAHRIDEGQAVKELLGGGMGMGAKTNQGSSTERVQGVKLRPRLDMGVFAEAVNETVHDLAYREAVADTMRMLNDKGVRNAIAQVAGLEAYRALVTRVREVAAPPRNPSGFIETAISVARRNTIINLMSGVKTALQNFTGLAPAMAEVNPGVLAGELARFYSPAMVERYNFAMEQSAFMRNRFTHYERDLQDSVKKLTVNGSMRPSDATFLALMGFVDKGVSVPVWNAAFKQGMGKFANDTAKAVDYADHVVRQTQGSGRDVDLAKIMSGHGGWGQLKKAFTMFYSYFNGQLNLLVKHGVVTRLEAREHPEIAAAKAAAKLVAIVVVPTVLTEMLMNGMKKDGESEEDQRRRFAGAFVKYGAGFFPLVRDVVPGIWAQMTGDKYFGSKLSPLDSAAEGVVRATKSAKDVITGEDDEKDTKSLVMGVGYLVGLPGKLITDTVEGTRAWLRGEAGPSAIVLGPPKK